MALLFYNAYTQPVWIAFAYYDPGCGATNQNFRKLGWWHLNSGQLFLAWDVDLRTVNRFAYFYAETANDGVDFSGTGNAWLDLNVDSGFNQCAFDNTRCDQWVDFVEIDFTWAQPGWDLMVEIGPGAHLVNFSSTQGIRP